MSINVHDTFICSVFLTDKRNSWPGFYGNEGLFNTQISLDAFQDCKHFL